MFVNWKKHLTAVALMGAVLTVASLSGPRQLLAQVAKAALVKDVDQPARQPFQASVNIDVNNFSFTPISIPAGKRLVVDFVSTAGAASSSGGGIQPIVLLNSSVAGSPSINYYLRLLQSTTAPTQFYSEGPVTIYADSLSVAPAFAGYTPSFMVVGVQISGHLIDIP